MSDTSSAPSAGIPLTRARRLWRGRGSRGVWGVIRGGLAGSAEGAGDRLRIWLCRHWGGSGMRGVFAVRYVWDFDLRFSVEVVEVVRDRCEKGLADIFGVIGVRRGVRGWEIFYAWGGGDAGLCGL